MRTILVPVMGTNGDRVTCATLLMMSAEDHKQALPPGWVGAYCVVRVLGVGGFGVTYLCEHAGLGVQVAVKEYLPNEIAVRDGTGVYPKSAGDREGFEWGLSRFLDEARTLARFEHPNVVRVRDCFEANNTAYIVMDYEDGEPLDVLLRRHGTLTEAQLKRVLLPVADGLRQVHAAGFLHRDIKPSNIFVRRSDESPVLLDFGSARQALGRRSRSVTAIASAGYSPPEQYESNGDQGAWTDIYALSALCYRAITGDAPMEATQRQSQLLRTQTDPLPKLAETPVASYSLAFLEAVDWGLRLIETERPQSLDDWLPQFEDAPAADQQPAFQSLAGSGNFHTGVEADRRPRTPEPAVALPLLSRIGQRFWSSVRRIFDTQTTPDAPAKGRLLGPTAYLRMLWRFLDQGVWHVGRLWRNVGSVTGGLGLGWTFWLIGVAGSTALGLGLAVLLGLYERLGGLWVVPIVPSAMAAGTGLHARMGEVQLWAVTVFLWSVAAKAGTWRAASTYSGPIGWAVLAKLYVLADALLTAALVITQLFS